MRPSKATRSPCNVAYSLVSKPEGGAEKWEFLVSDQTVIMKTTFSVLMVMRENVISLGGLQSLSEVELQWLRGQQRMLCVFFLHSILFSRQVSMGKLSFWDDAEDSSPRAAQKSGASSQFLSKINHHHKPVCEPCLPASRLHSVSVIQGF